jgi:aminopeptidase N
MTEAPRPIRLKDYRPPAFLIDKVDLNVRLDARRTEVRSRLAMRRNPLAATTTSPLQLDGEMLKLIGIKLNGSDLARSAFRLRDGALVIPKLPEQPFTLDIVTEIDPEANKALQGLYRSRGIYCTQCEAEGFRRITYFLDRPDVLARYTVRIEADIDEAPVLLANGNLVERGVLDRGRRAYAVWRDPFPKPCYLFAMVGGDLSSIASNFRTMSGRQVDLRIYVEHGKEARAAWAMDALKRAMRWDERRFGREYDLDQFNIVAVADFNMGAMENKGLNIFNDRLILASPETATDTTFESIESVVAHEYFHNWTGNRITCRDWFQLCLKEGLTVYRDQEFTGDERSPTVQRIADVRQLRALQFPEDSGPLAHPVRPESYIEINNFYTPTVYEKGAELVRMIATILGPEKFRAGMDRYFEHHDGRAAIVEDFISSFEAVADISLNQFMTWYRQAGTPELVCAFSYDKSRRTADLKIEQVLPPTPCASKKKPLHIPLKLGLVGSNGADMDIKLADGSTLADGVLHVRQRSQSFRFVDLPSRPVPSLLRGFSAPVRLSIDLSDRDLEFLIACDSDLFNRWQAANAYAMRTLQHIVRAKTDGKRSTRGIAYARALERTLVDEALEPAYRAEILKLPTQSDVARELAHDVDPQIIHRAHRQLSRLITATIGDTLERLYEEMENKGPFSPDAGAAGRRSLRNAVLTLLSARGEPDDQQRLAAHYFAATNMTDQAHALNLLCQGRSAERERAVVHFHERWKGDHLVIDTWFAAQAQSPLDGTIETVRALSRHPLFSMTTPNKVRALIGTFAAANPVQFNRPDGAGYALVAEKVIELNPVNPQIAARILGSFRSWRALEPVRQQQAKKALEHIAAQPALSRDVYEIVTRILEP